MNQEICQRYTQMKKELRFYIEDFECQFFPLWAKGKEVSY